MQSVTTYKNDVRVGETTMYYPSGKIYMKRNYIDNKLNEAIIYYYENGKVLLKGHLNTNTPYGDWEFYDKNGKLVTKGEFYKISETFLATFNKSAKKTLKNN